MARPFILFSELCDVWEAVQKDRKQLAQRVPAFFQLYREQQRTIYPLLRLMLPSNDLERIYQVREDRLVHLWTSQALSSDAPSIQILNQWKTTGKGDLSLVIERVMDGIAPSEDSTYTVEEVDELLEDLSKSKHPVESLRTIQQSFSSREQKWLVRIILKKLRVGYQMKTLLSLFHKSAPRFLSTHSSLRALAQALDTMFLEQTSAPIRNRVDVHTPISPMLAMRSTMAQWDEWSRAHPQETWYAETKWDGFRLLIHQSSQRTSLYSRAGRDVTQIYKDLIPTVQKALPDPNGRIVDGELLIWNQKEQKVEPYSEVRKYATHPTPHQHFFYVAFDVLMDRGVDWTSKPYETRMRHLDSMVHPQPFRFQVSPRIRVSSLGHVQEFFNQIVEQGLEGVLLKEGSSPYIPQARKRSYWIKLKPDYQGGMARDLDLLVAGGFYGSGKRGGYLSAYLLVLVSEKKQGVPTTYQTIGRVGSGLTEKKMKEITKDMLRHAVPQPPSSIQIGTSKIETPDVWIPPEKGIVFTINAAQIVPSKSYGSGYSIRHPRVESIRDDKTYRDVMDRDQLQMLLQTGSGGLGRTVSSANKGEKRPSFQNASFSLLVPPQDQQALRTIIEKHGGTVVSCEQATPTYIVTDSPRSKAVQRCKNPSEGLKVSEIRDWLKSKHLSTTGTKSVLQERVRQHRESPTVVSSSWVKNAVSQETRTEPGSDLSRWTVVELKNELRKRGLPVSGRKAELIARLDS